MAVSNERIHEIRSGQIGSGPVIYWMSRDQRANDNYALLYAQRVALERKAPLVVLFNLVDSFLGATARQYEFMLQGLEETSALLLKKDIPLIVTTGQPDRTVTAAVKEYKASLLIKDFSPLNIHKLWLKNVSESLSDVPFHEVDAHNIIPCRFLSEKQEYAAYTIRPKVKKQLNRFLAPIPSINKHPFRLEYETDPVDWSAVRKSLKVDRSVSLGDYFEPGEKGAQKVLNRFIEKRLDGYNEKRNDPTEDYHSDLSPYLHFGQISAQRAALEVQRSSASDANKDAFIEELVVRRELSDNFCLYNDQYDSIESFPEWARKTLDEHRSDERKHLYSREQFEQGETHDDLWNAAQFEMVLTGKMHGYMRMYWAKKILEWSATPEQALETAVYLNDKYELDGRDPNGYAGIAWSIGGVHDRAWSEREIFGKIRYMSYDGCKRKFDVGKYIDKIDQLKKDK